MDPANFVNMHTKLATYEKNTGVLFPWQRDGQVTRSAYKPAGEDRQANSALNGILIEFQRRSLELDVLSMTSLTKPADLLAYAFDLITVVSHSFADGSIQSGFVSLKSHSEAYLAGGGMAETRGAWEKMYLAGGSSMRERLSNIVEAAGSGQSESRIQNFVDILIETAGVAPLSEIFPASPAKTGARSVDMWPTSAFHARLAANSRWQLDTRESDWFRRFRLVLNLTYLHLTKAGLTPHQRFMICTLISNSVEDLYGVSALRMLEG
ncbi:hypothetical protein [Cryobacterium sp. N21]|uniref:hypothetical protein n=1 Tax=Cryobacterium sp. N21 TaxID=2048289 RepID=UPI0035133327